jgi:hypothetical protein
MSNQGTGSRQQWLNRAAQWEQRASDAGLAGVYGSLRDALMPLGPLAAQFLWVAQPTFGLFGEADSIGALADLLEQPPTHHHDDPSASQGGNP